MKLCGGIDLHSNNGVLHLVDENGALVLKKRKNLAQTKISCQVLPFALQSFFLAFTQTVRPSTSDYHE